MLASLWRELKQKSTQHNIAFSHDIQYGRKGVTKQVILDAIKKIDAEINRRQQVPFATSKIQKFWKRRQDRKNMTQSRLLDIVQNPSSKENVMNRIVEQQLKLQSQDVFVKIINKDEGLQDSFIVRKEWSKNDIYTKLMKSVAIPYETNGKDEYIRDNIDVYVYSISPVYQELVGSQFWKEGNTNCLLTPMLNKLLLKYEEYADKTTERVRTLKSGETKTYTQQNSTARKTMTLINKLKGFITQFHNQGVNQQSLQYICDETNFKVTIRNILDKDVLMVRSSKTKMSQFEFEYINTKTDHVDEYFEIRSSPTLIDHQQFQQFVNSIQDQSYCYDMSKGVISKVYYNGSVYINRSIHEMSLLIKDFKSTIPDHFNRYTIDQFKFLTRFATTNSHIEINSHLYDSDFTHIDQKEAYAQFKACDQYYLGFPNISDIREVPSHYSFALKHIGLYTCRLVSIDHSKITESVVKIYGNELRVNNFIHLSSPEIQLLVERGVELQLCWGAYGFTTLDLEFPRYMCDKKNYQGSEIRPFALLVGCMLKTKMEKEQKFIHTPDQRLMKYTGEKDAVVERVDNTNEYIVTYQTSKKHIKSAISTGCYITAYQRINMILQLEQLDMSKVYRVVTDGIYTTENNPKIRPTFRTDKEMKLGFKCGDRYIIRSDVDQMWFGGQQREGSGFELHYGLGGSGKTHNQLIDEGLVNCIYVAPTNKLMSNKRREYKDKSITTKFTNYSLILQEIDNKLSYSKYNPKNIILDEITMCNGATIMKIKKLYPQARIICCGDESQLFSKFGKEEDYIHPFNLDYSYKKYYDYSFRCKDEKLRELQNKIREMRLIGIAEDQQLLYVKQFIRKIQDIELKKLYNEHDMILVSMNDTKRSVNKLLGSTESLKYRVNKKCKINGVQYYNGDILITKDPIQNNNIEQTHTFTVHSIQGETFRDKIFLGECRIDWAPGYVYTAITRAEYLEQLIFVQESLVFKTQ